MAFMSETHLADLFCAEWTPLVTVAREERIFDLQRHVLERTGAVPAAAGMALTG